MKFGYMIGKAVSKEKMFEIVDVHDHDHDHKYLTATGAIKSQIPLLKPKGK